jgi:hypothetical protein
LDFYNYLDFTFYIWGNEVNYEVLDRFDLINLLDARDTEIAILSSSCTNLLADKLRLQQEVKDLELMMVGSTVNLFSSSNEDKVATEWD